MGNLGEVIKHVTEAIRTNSVDNLEKLLTFEVVRDLAPNIDDFMHLAINLERSGILQLLLEKFDVKIPNDLKTTMLFTSNDAFLLRLLDACVDLTVQDTDTALHIAILRSTVTVARSLIKNGADVNAKNFDGYTPMHLAVERGHEEAVCMLLYYDADPNVVTRVTKMTPFMLSLRKRHENIQRLLIDYVTDFNLENSYRFSTLDLALKYQSVFSVDIVALGAKFNMDLLFTNIDVFNAAWSVINRGTLSNQRFPLLKKLLFNRNLPYNHFRHYLFTLITCETHSDYLINQYLNVHQRFKCTLFADVMECLYEYKMDTADVISIMYILLSKGVPVYVNDLYYTFKYFGYGPEFETFLITNPDVCSDRLFHNFPLFLDCLVYNKLEERLGIFTDFSTFLKFYAPTENFRRLFSTSVENFTSAQLPHTTICNQQTRVPSLKQVSRDAVREIVYCINKGNKLLNFYSVIGCLPVPKVVRDILMLKKPLYTSYGEMIL